LGLDSDGAVEAKGRRMGKKSEATGINVDMHEDTSGAQSRHGGRAGCGGAGATEVGEGPGATGLSRAIPVAGLAAVFH
jgi:hypothetical protein